MKKTKADKKREALVEVRDLFSLADKDKKKANDCVRKARRIAMKVNLPLPKMYKRKFCKHCYNYFRSNNVRVRTRNKMVVYYCLKCKKYMKFLLRTK